MLHNDSGSLGRKVWSMNKEMLSTLSEHITSMKHSDTLEDLQWLEQLHQAVQKLELVCNLAEGGKLSKNQTNACVRKIVAALPI